LEEGVAFSNEYAPEHLILHLEDSAGCVEKIDNAGSVFVGQFSPESYVPFFLLHIPSPFFSHLTPDFLLVIASLEIVISTSYLSTWWWSFPYPTRPPSVDSR
jgi:hypothetical protein